MIRSTIALATAVLLAGCGSTASQNAVAQGQLFCAESTATGPLVVALANVSGVPVTVTGKASAEVAAACAVIGAIPVSPPSDPAAAPVVAAAVPAAAAVSVPSANVAVPVAK